MEKNINRRAEAMKIYQEGIKLFPRSAKLWEDAGALAMSLGDIPHAIELFEKALDISKRARLRAKGVLLKLAQAHYELGTFTSLKACVEYYRAAVGNGHSSLSSSDLGQMNIALVRTQHQRGNIAVKFLQDAGFRISRAQLHANVTESADLFVQQSQYPELIESYGLAGHLLVLCFFKATISPADLQELDERIAEWAKSDLIDEQVAFIVVGSLSEELQRMLSGRIEQKNRPQAAIVPITQSEIETSSNSLDSLRAIMDRWLFRRDLFATNSPVSGSKFFGRDKPLAELRDAIASNTCAGVYDMRRFLNGTPNVLTMYSAHSGYEILNEFGEGAIRANSTRQTQRMIPFVLDSFGMQYQRELRDNATALASGTAGFEVCRASN